VNERLSVTACSTSATLRPRCVASVRVGGGVGRHLLRHHVVDRLAVAGDGVRGADVRARRHRRDIGGHRDEETRRGRAVSRGADEDRHRRLRADDGVIDVARGVEQAARRVQREDDQRGPFGIGLRDRLAHELRRDRVDDAVDRGRLDNRT
jgi:hypothetical protein